MTRATHKNRDAIAPAVVAAICTLHCASTMARAQVCFGNRTVDAAIEGPRGMASGDLDGDGDIDILAVSPLIDTVTWFESDGASPPGYTEHTLTTSADGVSVVCAVDVDGDTDIDILTTGATSSTIVWHENNGLAAPEFTQRTVAVVSGAMLSILGADLDGNGSTDVVFRSGTTIGWCENDGATTPTFTVRTIASGSATNGNAAAADMDGDTDLDVVAPFGIGPTQVRYWENDGANPPGFAAFHTVLPQVSSSGRIVVSDVDGDSDQDVAATSFSPTNTLLVAVSDGASPPAFASTSIPTPLDNVRCWAAEDLDGDGDSDLLVASESLNSVAWVDADWLAPASFDFRSISSSVSFVGCVLGTDLDGDADIDVVASAYLDDSIEWFERIDVTIAETNAVYPLIGPAMDAALAGQTVIAHPEHFAPTMAPVIDFDGKALTLESRGALVIPPGSSVALAHGCLLRAAIGSPAIVNSTLELPPGASATIVGSSVVIGGPVDFNPGSGVLTLEGSTGAVKGAAAFATLPLPTPTAPGAGAVVLADFDDDGDLDLVTPMGSSLRYFENDLVASVYIETILGTGSALNRASACDIDGDDDLDIVSADQLGTVRIDWWQNNGAHPPVFTRRLISSAYPNAVVSGADLDGDGDGDVIAAVRGQNAIRWFRNNGGSPPTFTVFTLPGAPQLPQTARPADIDADGDIDIIAASQDDDTIAWYENVGGPSASMFTRRVIATSADGAADASASDIDGDGDLDVLSASSLDNTVAWYENSGTSPITWVKRAATTDATGVKSTVGADLDDDGDCDILAAAASKNSVEWYENHGGAPPIFIQHTVAAGILSPFAIAAGDLDLDGRIDAVTGAGTVEAIWIHRGILERTLAVPAGATIAATAVLQLINRALDLSAGASAAAPIMVSIDRTGGVNGPGAVTAPLIASAGTLSPGPNAELAINGNYTQIFDNGVAGPLPGALSLALGTGTAPSAITVTGTATLAGTVRATASPGFAPSFGSSFEILSAASLAPGSRFATALLPNIGVDRFLSVVYNEGTLRAGASVSLVVNPLTGDVALDPQAGADSGADGIPKGAVLADIDNDGDPDLFIALPDAANPATANGSVVILYNADDGNPANGWEGFGDTLQITTGVGVNPSSVAVGRIDANTQPDIVVSNRGTPGSAFNDTVSILLVSNPSAVSFALSATHTVTVGDEPADVIVADLDGDGILDIATANAGSDSISIGWNAGAGTGPTYAPPTSQPIDLPDEEDTPVSVRPGDTNASGFAFLAAANSCTNTIGLVQINPNRTTLVLPNIPAGKAPVEIVVADLNLDGEDDIATVNRNSASITLVLGETGLSPTLVMGLPSDLPIPSTSSAPRSLAAGDFDSDANGDIDLAILADGVVKVLRNDLFNGQLGFTPIPDQPAGATPLLVRASDLNVDGRDDVVTIAESTGLRAWSGQRAAESVNILLAAPEPCAGDVTGDGDTNVSDFNVLASHFGQSVTANTSGDLTGDGFVNVSDFNILAGNFGCTAN